MINITKNILDQIQKVNCRNERIQQLLVSFELQTNKLKELESDLMEVWNGIIILGNLIAYEFKQAYYEKDIMLQLIDKNMSFLSKSDKQKIAKEEGFMLDITVNLTNKFLDNNKFIKENAPRIFLQ